MKFEKLDLIGKKVFCNLLGLSGIYRVIAIDPRHDIAQVEDLEQNKKHWVALSAIRDAEKEHRI